MKKITLPIVFIYVVSFLFFPVNVLARTHKPQVNASSAVIYDVNKGKILYAKNIYVKRPVASITKVMTAIVVLEHLSLNKKVCVSYKASLAQPSKVYLNRGRYYTVKDLLYALLLESGNDAAICLSEAVAGSEWEFVRLMNAKAYAVGARHTRFVNASGLPGKGQYSTAYDLVKIMKYASRYSVIRKIMATKKYKMKSGSKRMIFKNHNKLLWLYSKKVIGKTGYTRKAGKCFLGEAFYGKRKVIICVLRSSNIWSDSRNLLDYVFGKDNRQLIYQNKLAYSKSEIRRIQLALKRAGCSPGRIDGLFGHKTLSAVLKFQSRTGLKADGLIGPKTLRQLRNFM